MGKLKQAAKDLRRQWDRVHASWADENSRRFEQERIAPLLLRLRTAEMSMARLASIVQHARRDCE